MFFFFFGSWSDALTVFLMPCKTLSEAKKPVAMSLLPKARAVKLWKAASGKRVTYEEKDDSAVTTTPGIVMFPAPRSVQASARLRCEDATPAPSVPNTVLAHTTAEKAAEVTALCSEFFFFFTCLLIFCFFFL
jgi:hypothetical protein